MVIQNEKYKIVIKIDESYTIESADNQHYDLVINPSGYKRNDLHRTFNITIEKNDEIIKIALIGDFYAYDTDCAILEGNILVVLQNNKISQINIDECCLIEHKKFDCIGCNFGIYKVNNGYIIYGEIEILMLDFDFCKKWSFSGRDIFVSQFREKPFEICDNLIRLYDWEDNYYEIDFDGNLLTDN